MRVLVATAVAVAVLSGCVGLGEDPCRDAALRTPWIDAGYLRTDPGQPWDTVVLRQGEASVAPSAQPAGWDVETLPVWQDAEGDFSILRVNPGHERGRLDLDYEMSDCKGVRAGTISWELAAPRAGDAAEPGQGTHVYTAGFWENGTLFYTNIKAIDHDDWPRAGWYAWEGDEPLPVYVYDEDRSEQPLVWTDPLAMTPVAGAGGLGYYTTIPGFNEALKGLSTTTVRVVRLAPEDAYTRPGNEDHPLYGDALVFYIKVVDVVDLPCPLETGRLCGATSWAR